MGGIISVIEGIGELRERYDNACEEWAREKEEYARKDAAFNKALDEMEMSSKNVPNFGRTTSWMSSHELLPLLHPGDIIEERIAFYNEHGQRIMAKQTFHAAIYIGNEEVIHYRRNNHNEPIRTTNDEFDLMHLLANGSGIWSIHCDNLNESIRNPCRINNSTEEMTISNGRRGILLKNDSPWDWFPYSSSTIVQRAKSRLGESTFHVLNNNCLSFANWCRYGQNRGIPISLFDEL